MILRRAHKWRLRDYVLLSWIGPSALAIVASLMVFVLLGWLDYKNNLERITSDLEQKSLTAARRASAEILLGENGALPSVLEFLTQQLAVLGISVEKNICSTKLLETCTSISNGVLTFNRKIPHLDGASFVSLSYPIKPLWASLNLYLLVWSALPVFLALVTGLILQRMYLRRYVIEPINSLVTAAERRTHIPTHWPIELKEIAQNLADSFEAREQQVFALLAKGVIHDIKTFLHSLLTATDLVREQRDSEKRQARLESLYRACNLNLPKMKRIIELTLDGSRDIPIRPEAAPIDATIQGAIEANRDQARSKGVTIDYRRPGQSLLVAHDPVQLERAISNLIRNGIEAAEQLNKNAREKTVRITTEDEATGVISVSVEDTGTGLGDQTDLLFKPTKSNKPHGAGLGLYITGKIVRGHGGFIRAGHSDALGGASFTLSLPKQPIERATL